MSDPNTTRSSGSNSTISFKLQSSSSRPKPSDSGRGYHHGPSDVPEVDKKDYLLSVEGNTLQSVVPAAPPKEYIVPLIKKNQWRLPVKPEGNKSSTTTITEADQEAADAILKDIQSSKFTGSSGEGDNDQSNGPIIPLLMQNKPPVDNIDDDKLNDLSIRPNESSIDDYEDMPIDHFGAAMLKGMGWKPGEAIGLNKKGLLEPIEYIAHPGGLGLGATMRPHPHDDLKNKRKDKIKKPGQVERKKVVPYIDKDGRVKHIKKIGEEIPEQIPEGFYPGNHGRVRAGTSTGLCGKIVSVENENVVMRMIINNEDMIFNRDEIELISKANAVAPTVTRDSSKKEYGLILSGKKDRQDQSTTQRDSPANSDSKSQVKEEQLPPPEIKEDNEAQMTIRTDDGRCISVTMSDIVEAIASDTRSKEERQQAYYRQITALTDKYIGRSAAQPSTANTKDQSEGSKGPGVKRSINSDEGSSSSKKTKLMESKNCWLRSQLRVRIIDRKYKKGRYYNKKAVIVDIVDPTTCICQTDEGKLLEGVRLDMLETMVPKEQDAVVMVLKGESKGQLANLLKRNNSECIATIQFIQSKEVMEIDYDDICEFVGETYL